MSKTKIGEEQMSDEYYDLERRTEIKAASNRLWGIGIPIKRLTRRYAVAIKWRYGNTWVDLALIYKPSYIYKRWRGKIQGVRERFLN